MEGSEEVLQSIVDLLVAGGYVRARISSLHPFDKLTGGLAWCITACNVDIDIDLFYDNDATLEYKLKVGETIEGALQKMECPYPLQAHQIHGLDYSAVYPVVQWLVKRVLTSREMLGDQVFSPAINKSYKLDKDAEVHLKHETSSSPASSGPWSQDDSLCSLKVDHVAGLPSKTTLALESQPVQLIDAQSCHQRQVVALLKQIAEEEKTNESLQEQRKDLAAQMLKVEEMRKDQEREESELFLEIKILKETIERAEAGELMQKLLPLLKQSKMSQEEELTFQSSCEQKHMELLTIIQKLESEEKDFQERKNYKAEVENILQQDFIEYKLLRRDMAKKNQKFIVDRRKLDELPSQSELMQYERCFVEIYLHIQAKLQETRKYFATHNALAEANEITLKEISLLNSINAQFEDVMTSQEGRSKFVASMSEIAKGVSQKVEKMEARFLAEKNALSALKKRHSQLVAERRRYENLMKLFPEECARNEVLRSSLHQAA